MEDHVVLREAAAVSTRKRKNHSPELIGRAVTEARHHGAQAASLAVNKNLSMAERVGEDTIRSWLGRWRKEGDFWTKQCKRGRKSIKEALPQAAAMEWKKQVDALRTQGEPVTSRAAAAIGRAVLEDKTPSLLERHGGSVKFCKNTGRQWLRDDDMSYRKKTSSKIIPPADVVAASRDSFYKKIVDSFPNGFPVPALTINFDQTFLQYHPSRGYTWEKRGSDRVQLTQNKDGFTFLPVVSVEGVIGAQLIFGGTTAAVLPSVQPGALLQYHFNSSHWSTEETTLKLFQQMILPYIARQRVQLGDDAAPVLILGDAFGAHWTKKVTDVVASTEAVVYICVPESLTHLFQPLDLGIIAAMKHSIKRRMDDFLEDETLTAIRENRTVVLSKSRPVLRDRITSWIKELLSGPVVCARHCCRAGFNRAGITRLLFGDSPQYVDVDAVVPPPVCSECGEFGCQRTELPNCVHFTDVDAAILCSGCLRNHCELCDAAE